MRWSRTWQPSAIKVHPWHGEPRSHPTAPIADELASGNDIVMESGALRFVSHVPDVVTLKVEFEVEDDETEFEIELTW